MAAEERFHRGAGLVGCPTVAVSRSTASASASWRAAASSWRSEALSSWAWSRACGAGQDENVARGKEGRGELGCGRPAFAQAIRGLTATKLAARTSCQYARLTPFLNSVDFAQSDGHARYRPQPTEARPAACRVRAARGAGARRRAGTEHVTVRPEESAGMGWRWSERMRMEPMLHVRTLGGQMGTALTDAAGSDISGKNPSSLAFP